MTAANVNDTTVFQAIVDDVPPVRTPSGRRRTRPGKLHADKGYDSRGNRVYLRRRGIRARIARRQIESSSRLGRHRWKVERSLSWLSCWRRLQVRWDRDAGRWFAFVLVACALVCFNRLYQFKGGRWRLNMSGQGYQAVDQLGNHVHFLRGGNANYGDTAVLEDVYAQASDQGAQTSAYGSTSIWPTFLGMSSERRLDTAGKLLAKCNR
jgi:transposase